MTGDRVENRSAGKARFFTADKFHEIFGEPFVAAAVSAVSAYHVARDAQINLFHSFFVRLGRVDFGNEEFGFFKIPVNFAFCADNVNAAQRLLRAADHVVRAGGAARKVDEHRLVVYNVVVAFVNAFAVVAVAF